MATIRRIVHTGEEPSAEAVKEIAEAEKMPVSFDDDSPEFTTEEYARMAELAKARRFEEQRVPVSLRLKRKTVLKAKAFGKGYTGFLSRLVDNAMEDEDLIRKSL